MDQDSQQTYATPRTDLATWIVHSGGPTPKPFVVTNQNGRLHVAVWFAFPDQDGQVSRIVSSYKESPEKRFFDGYSKLMSVVKSEKSQYMERNVYANQSPH